MNLSDLKDVLMTTKKLVCEAGKIILEVYSKNTSIRVLQKLPVSRQFLITAGL
jgi:hypothetical protein